MRLNVLLCFAVAGLLLIDGARLANCGKPRTKPREIRGYQPDQLMTAIDFGKRTKMTDARDPMLADALPNSSQRISDNWLLQVLLKNPELIQGIASSRKFMNNYEENDPYNPVARSYNV